MATPNQTSFSDAPATQGTTAQGGSEAKKTGNSWGKNAKAQTSAVSYGFEGAKAEIGAVLGMRHERMKLKVMFDEFVEKFTNYLTSNMTGARDVVKTVTDRDDALERIDVDEPVDLTEEEERSKVKVMLKTEEVKKFGARRQLAKDNLVKVYGLIWGQCSPGLQTAMKGEDGYDDALDGHDVLLLLENLQKVVSGVDTKANRLYVEQEALVAFTTMRQGATESTDGFIMRVKHNAETLKIAGGERYLYDEDLLSVVTRQSVDRAIEKYISMHVIRRSDQGRFGDLQKSLLEGSHRGQDEYPTTLQDVYALMIRQPKETQIGSRKGGSKNNHGNFMFAMVGKDGDGAGGDDGDDLVPGTDGRIIENECYICRKKGHISWYCPEAGNTGPPPRNKQNLNCAQFGFVQSGKNVKEEEVIDSNWILLDTCSTVSVCCNQNLVRDVRKCGDDEILTILTNGGSQTYEQMAVMKDFPLEVHFKRDSLVNIIALRDVANIPGVTIRMDTSKERAITVEMGPHKCFKFIECPNGLYHYDTNTFGENDCKPKTSFTLYSRSNSNPYTLAMTVEENKKYFTKKEVAAAEAAQKLQQELG